MLLRKKALLLFVFLPSFLSVCGCKTSLSRLIDPPEQKQALRTPAAASDRSQVAAARPGTYWQLRLTPSEMVRLPSRWEEYFGVHYSRVRSEGSVSWKTVRGYGGPHVGIPPERSAMGAGAPVRTGPFTGRRVRIGLRDIRRHKPPVHPSMDILLPEIIKSGLTAIYGMLMPVKPDAYDKDIAYWALRDIYEQYPAAEKHLAWQLGNEINGLHFDPQGLREKIEKRGETPWKYMNRAEKIPLYVNGYFAPAVETLRRVSLDTFGQPDRLKVLSGSFANIYNPAFRDWMRQVMNRRIHSLLARSLEGDPVWKHVDILTVHYAFAQGTGEEVMQEIYDEYVKTGKVKGLWLTEEHGRSGKGPVTIVRRGFQFIDWVARNRLSADRTRLVWWGTGQNKAGGKPSDTIEMLGRFLAGAPVRFTRLEQGRVTLYVLAHTDAGNVIDALVAIVPSESSPVAIPPLRIEFGKAPPLVRAEKSPADVPASPAEGSWGPRPMRGANVGTWLSEADLKVLKSWRANHVRAQILKYKLFEGKNGCTLAPDAFQRLDGFLARVRRAGLRAVLDFHSHGDIFPNQNWKPEAQTAWEDPARRSRLVSLWRNIAAHFADDRALIAGYDILNEPHPPYTDAGYAAWNSLAKEVTRAIREVDPFHTIVVECAGFANPGGMEKLQPTGDPNTVYSFHAYVPHEFTEQGTRKQWPFGQTYPGTIGLGWDAKSPALVDRAWLKRALQPVVEFQREHHARIWVGEFSARREAPSGSALRYLKDLLEIVDRHGWDWCYHAFRESRTWDLERCDRAECRERHSTTPRLELLKDYWKRPPKTWSARAVWLSTTVPPERTSPQVKVSGTRLIIELNRQISDPVLLFLRRRIE